MEAKNAGNTAVLCPAEALNSESRQRRPVITRKVPGGAGDGEKSCVKRESGICQRLPRINDDERTGGEAAAGMGVQENFYLSAEGACMLESCAGYITTYR